MVLFCPKTLYIRQVFWDKTMRPKNYTFLGKTDRIRVPFVKQFSIILMHLNRIAELGHDPTDYLDEFIERLEQVD
jgi:hypothetical protein